MTETKEQTKDKNKEWVFDEKTKKEILRELNKIAKR